MGLEQSATAMVYSPAMRKTHSPRGRMYPANFGQFLRSLLLISMVIAAVNPVVAGMGAAMGTTISTNVNTTISTTIGTIMDDSFMVDTVQSGCQFLPDGNCSHTGHDMSTSTIDCEQDCNCCPGLCSVYVPMAELLTGFSPARSLSAKILSEGTIVSLTPLYRPPIFS
jgi:hypothetical protein